MDKKLIIDAIADSKEFHSLPKGIRPIHRSYGLWICKFGRAQSCPPRRPDELPFRRFGYYDLSHMYDGKGWYCPADGTLREVEKGDGILVSPGAAHKYGGDREDYVEDAVSFHGPVADMLLSAGVVKDGILKIGGARRLLPIIELAQDGSDDSQIKANLALQSLLVSLYLENKEASPIDSSIEQLMEKIKGEPRKSWDVASMAEFSNLSVSQFKRLFRMRSGVTPKTYVDGFKMRLAVEMLSDSSKAVSDVAAALGYCDQFHFSRRFRQMTGHSPSDYRRRFCRLR